MDKLMNSDWKLRLRELFHTPGGVDHDQQSHAGKGGGGEKWKQTTDQSGRPIPIRVKSVDEAVGMILDGKVIELEDVRSAYVTISRLAQVAQEMKAAGKQAKDFDLCQVHVRGSNLFCAQSLRTEGFKDGIPRIEMPQLGGKPKPGSEADKLPRNPWDKSEVDAAPVFIKHLESIGIKATPEVVPASQLKASQRELVGSKVAKMILDKNFDPATNPIFVSRDNYVVDGHHRWAAVVGRDLEDGTLGGSKMNIVRVDAPISELLHISSTWASDFGIEQSAGVQKQTEATGIK